MIRLLNHAKDEMKRVSSENSEHSVDVDTERKRELENI